MLRKLELKTLLDLKASRRWPFQHILEPWRFALLFSLSLMRKREKLEGRKCVPTHSRSQIRGRAFWVSTKNRGLWTGPTPEIHDSRTSYHSAHAQDQVWQIWLAENAKRLLCACSENWTLPEASGSENAYLSNYHNWIEFNPWVLSYYKTKLLIKKLQTFINKCLKMILNIRWPEVISNEEQSGGYPVLDIWWRH